MKLEVDKTYKLVFLTGKEVVVTLVKIESYPSIGFPVDYIFEYISGDRSLVSNSMILVLDSPKKTVCNKDLLILPERLFMDSEELFSVEEINERKM